MISFAEWKNSKKKEQNKENSVSFAEWSNKKTASQVDQAYLDSFFADTDAFFKASNERYNTIGWSNAQSLYDTTSKEWSDLRNRANKISTWAEYYKDQLDEETYNSITETLSSINKSGNSIYSGFHQNRNFYSQFDTEDAYNEWYEKDQIRQGFENVKDTDPMFSDYAQSGTEVTNPTWKKANGGWKLFGDTSEPVLNMVTFAEENGTEAFKDSAQALRGGGGDLKHTEIVTLINQYMKDDEKAIYNYYVGKGDTEKANEYLAYITDILRQRQAGDIVSKVDNTGWELAFSGIAGLEQWYSGVKNIGNLVKGTEGEDTSTLQYAHSEMSSNNEGIWKVTNDLANTTGNMLPSILVGSFTGGLGGALTMGVSASGNAYSEMRSLGYDEWQSRGYALLTGASETVLSYALGGISKLGGKVTGNAVGKLVSKIDNAIARTAITVGGNMVSEGLEEAIQTALEPAFKALMTGEEFESAEWDEILYSALLGALSAGMLEGAPTIAGTVSSSINANKIYGNDAQALVTESLEIDPDNAHAQRMQSRLDAGKSVSGYQINRLVEANESTLYNKDSSKIKDAVVNRLLELGEVWDVNSVADAITKQTMGADLTATEKRAIQNSSYGYRVATELDSKNVGSGNLANKWAETIGTEKYNVDEYNRGIPVEAETSTTANIPTKEGVPGKALTASVAPKEAPSVTENTTVKENATEAKFEASESAEFSDINFRRAIQAAGINMSVTDALAPTIKKYVSGDITSRSELADVIRSEFGDKIGTYKLTEDNLFSLVNVIDTEASKTANGVSVSASKASQAITKATMHDSEGNDVDVKVAKIADVENGEASLELEDGKTVKASDVDFGDSGVGIVYKAAAEMVSGVGGFNLDAANLMVRGFNPSGTEAQALAYTAGFNKAYREGALGYPLSALATGEATSKLTPKQREMAYNLGKAYGEGKVAEKQAKIVSTLTKKDENISKKASQKGKVYFDGSTVGKSLTERQRASLKGLRVVAEGMGVNIHIFESKVVDGKRQGANGWYDPSDRSIHIDLHAGADGNGVMLFTASHELTHHIREISPAKFKIFADALLEEYTKNGVSLDELIADKIEQLERNGRLKGLTEEQAYDLAYEEVVADACESMLVDSNAMEALSRKIHGKDKSLWETIKDFIAKLVTRIKAAYEGLDPDSAEGKKVREMTTSAERLQKLWVDALIEANEVNTGHSDHKAANNNNTSPRPTVTETKATPQNVNSPAEFNATNFKRAIYNAGVNMTSIDSLLPTIKKYVTGEIASKAELMDAIRSEFGDKIGTYKLTENNLISLVNIIDDVASKEANASKGVSAKGDVKYQDRAVDTNSTEYKINTSMTMAEAKRMIETAYKVNNIAEYYEGEYANAEDWLKKAGSDEVEMYIENDFDLQAKYVNSNEDILNEEYRISDVLDAYLAGTLIGKEKPKPKRLDVSQSTKLEDSRFYSPQKIKDAKATFELAKQKAVGKDTAAINRARSEILLFAHNKGAAELLGVTQADLNKKLRSWSNYSATARDISERINAGVAEENRWTGIENSSYINKAKVTNEDIERLVASVEGDSKGYERKYIARVMLAADTHIDYSGLKFKFASSQQVNEDHPGGNSSGRVLGFYDDTNRQIEVTHDKPNTVAHEMGHYIDAQWGRELVGSTGSHLFLTRGINADIVRERYGEPGVQFLNNFKLFINSLSDVNQTYNSYYNDRGEIFARFFARFIEWTDNIATGNKYYSYESTMYGDKFTQAQYVEFARLLQEKALLDGSALTANNRSQNEKGGDAARSGINYSLEETIDGRLVAVVDDDILSGIYTGTWDKATEAKAKKAAKTALLKFKGGIAVKGITASVNKISRDEYTRSNYSEALRRHDPNTYADKLRAAAVADDVVIAATGWNRDGGLTHPRKDDFVDFDRGQTLIMSGTNQYAAEVIIGITSKGEFVFYDVGNMYPTQFDIKNLAQVDIKNEGVLPAVTPDKPFDAILKDSNGDIIPQDSNSVNRNVENKLYSLRDTVEKDVLKRYGKTYRWNETGYIFKDGTRLDLSGRNEGASGGYRSVDHRDIFDIYEDSGNAGTEAMVEFMGRGNIRVMPESPGVNIQVEPTQQQYEQIASMVESLGWKAKSFSVDFDNARGYTIDSLSYEGNVSARKVVADIKYYFKEGKIPYQSELSQFRYSDRRADVSDISREIEKAYVEPKDVVALADGYFDNYGGVMNKSEMRYDFLHAMQTMLEKSDDAYERAFEEIESIAEELVYNPKNLGSVADDFREMKNHIRSIRFKVQDRDKPEFGIYGGFGTFRKEHMGKLTLANNGISVDSVYMELQGLYGTSYFPDVNTVAEQLMVIADIVDTPLSAVADTEYTTEGASDYTAQEIVAKFADFISASYKKEQENKAKNTTKYINYRNPDSYSNRSLLAGALETAVQNDIERSKLKQYKEKIALINSEEQKLNDLRAQIKELSFAKGPRDAEAIRKLQFEANQAANRINTYDKQLLNLESTKALKGVLEREKAQARKRDAQKYKEAIDRYREKSAKTQRELMDRYQESRRRGTESRNKTAMRHKIKDVVNELNQYLLKGTKDKHVPIELQKAVAEALDAVNMDTVGAEERIAKLKAEMMRAKTPEAVQEIAKTIEHIEEMGGNMEAKLSRLKTAYDDIINSEDPLIANSYDEVISNTIDRVKGYVGETPLRDMSLSQLEEVYDMYRMVLHSIRGANKAFKAKKSEEISVIANRVMEEVDKLGKKKKLQTKAGEAAATFDWNNQKPIYAFERIGSNTFTEVFNNVRAGEDTWAVDMSEAKSFREEQEEKYKYSSWDFDKKYDFTSSTGKNFSLSLGQIMSLYAYAKRGTQAKDHLKNGGFVFDGLTEVKEKGKLGVTVTYQLKDSTAYNLSDEILSNIISKLTEEQKAFADAMQAYLSDTMGDKGNEVSLELYGVKLFKEKNYFPLKSAPQFLERAREQAQGEVKIKNKGFTKETTPKAKNPIVLTSFMDVWAGHVNEMSMYHAFTLALEDFYRVYNYKTPASETLDSESVISFLENAHGNASVSYIDQLLKDLNGGARSDPRENAAKAMMSKFKKASVIASASVVIQQLSAIVRAQALVDAKYFVGKKMSEGKHKETWAEVKKYAPVAIIKEMGYFDVGMGQGSVEWLKGEKTWRDKVDDALSKAPALADEYTWVAIWNAVKRETAHNNPTLKTSSEDFLKLAGERFTEVITKTQVYDSTLARSANMRSKSGLMNMWTAFMAEPTTSINMLQDALKKGDKKYIARTMGAVYGSVVLNAALVSLVYAMRDDDEDETFLEKYMSRFVTEVIDGINPLTYIPFVKDIWSALQGYDIERSDMTLITSFIGSLQQLVKVAAKDTSNMSEDELTVHKKAVTEAILGITDTLASLTGLPVKNIRRDINGVINGIKTLVEDSNGRKTTAGSLGDNILEDVKDSIPVWGWFPDESKGDKLYDAIIKGDDDYVERLESGYKSQSAIDSAIRKALRENDPRIKEAAEALSDGDFREYQDILDEIVDEGNFDFKNVKAAILKEYEDMTPDEETITGDKVEKEESAFETEWVQMAISMGDTATAKTMREEIINAHIANGKSREEAETSFNNTFGNSVKKLYEDGDISNSEAKSMLVNFGGKTKEEAESKVQYWSFKKQYPDYDLTESAVSKYYSDVKPSGISVEVYYDYTQKRSKAQGVDLNGDGKADSGSVKREVMQMINSLPISSYQKDALYYLNGWSQSTLWEAPWH